MSDRNLKIGLIVSVILNVFLIGGVAGGLAFWRLNPQVSAGAAPAAGAQLRRPLRFAADDLAPAQQRAFRQTLRQARIDSLPRLREAQAHRRDLVGLLRADRFDGPAVSAALDGARDADIAVRARLEAAVVDFAATLSPEDRRTLTRRLPWVPPPRAAPGQGNRQIPATEMPAPAR